MTDELERRFAEAQRDVMDEFKLRMLKVVHDSLSDFYCGVSVHAVTDAHTNFREALRDEMGDSFCSEISSENGHYSWAHSIRMKILETHPEALKNKIIEDLQEKIKSLEGQLDQALSRRY